MLTAWMSRLKRWRLIEVVRKAALVGPEATQKPETTQNA